MAATAAAINTTTQVMTIPAIAPPDSPLELFVAYLVQSLELEPDSIRLPLESSKLK